MFIGRTNAEAEAPILWPPDANSHLLEKTLMLGKIEDKRKRGRHRTRWLDGIIDSMDRSLSKFQVIVKDRKAWGAAAHGIAKSPTSLRVLRRSITANICTKPGGGQSWLQNPALGEA